MATKDFSKYSYGAKILESTIYGDRPSQVCIAVYIPDDAGEFNSVKMIAYHADKLRGICGERLTVINSLFENKYARFAYYIKFIDLGLTSVSPEEIIERLTEKGYIVDN